MVIESKYNIGEMVYYIENNQVKMDEIINIQIISFINDSNELIKNIRYGFENKENLYEEEQVSKKTKDIYNKIKEEIKRCYKTRVCKKNT